MVKQHIKKDYLASELSPFEPHPMGWSQLLAWIYPNRYEIGMANIGYQWLYGTLRSKKHILTERFFNKTGESRSLESDRPLREFPVIAVSMPYETDILNLIEMLVSSGIEPIAKKRGDTPIIIGGGDALTLNPFPFAAFFDIILLGDGDNWAERFPEIMRDSPPGLATKAEILEMAKRINGVWAPALDDGEEIVRAPATRTAPAYTPILTSFGHFRNMFLVEGQRGCPFNCGFCASSWLDMPVYNYSTEGILRTYDDFGLGAKRVGLVGSAIAEHPELESILRGFSDRGVSIHPSSIRLDRISTIALELLAETKSKSVTFAPETASERLAQSIGKWIPREEIVAQANALTEMGFAEMKLYWIIGLPGENEADIAVLADTIVAIASSSNLKVTCSINSFIPKPHSRFQFEPMLSHSELTRRFTLLKSRVKGIRNLKLELNYSRRSRLSAIISIGGNSIANAILDMTDRGIKHSLSEIGINLDDEIRSADNPPWDRIS